MTKLLIKLTLIYVVCVMCHYLGYQKGWEGYKKSRQMQYALDSSYQYGVSDCMADRQHQRIK